MIRKRDPREPVLISRFDSLLCRTAINTLKNGWEGIFRAVIPELLPIRKVEEKFSHSRGKIYTTAEQPGYDMQKQIAYFANDKKASNMNSYKDMVRVFSEQFIDVDGKAELNPHPGGKVLINPSDPDAEIGHKRAGYHVQTAETMKSSWLLRRFRREQVLRIWIPYH